MPCEYGLIMRVYDSIMSVTPVNITLSSWVIYWVVNYCFSSNLYQRIKVEIKMYPQTFE